MVENQQHDLRRRIKRRKLLKATGAGLLSSGVAGCTGGQEDGDGGMDGGDGASSNQETPTPREVVETRVGEPNDDVDLSDVSFSYWNIRNVQSRQARSVSETLVSSFQQSTGADIRVNWSGYGGIIGAEWKTSFQQGDYPVMYEMTHAWGGQFIEGEWVKPLDEYMDQFDDETISAIEWIFPTLKKQWRGFGDTLWEIPFGFLVQVPFIARLDHFDEAGLSRDRYPPEDYDDLIDIATTLQNDGPGQYGYQIHGTLFDSPDCRLPQMAVAEGGEEGLFLNEDWTDTNWDNDVFKKVLRQWTEIYTEHELSDPETPQHDDEAITQKLPAGTHSMSHADFLNHPDYQENMTDLMEQGDVQWGETWGGNSGQMGILQPQGFGITVPPEGADESEWERKQTAAIEFMKFWLNKDVQRNLFSNFGIYPVRQDVWEEFPTENHRLFEVATTMAENSDFAWSAHPQTVAIQYNIPGPRIQEALQGQLTPEEAADTIAEEIRDQIL